MKRFLISLATLTCLPAWGDNIGLPTNTPGAYKTECGSCHAPYPPALLSAADWRKTMANLGQHFGTDASLDAKTQSGLQSFLEANAGRRAATGKGAEARFTTGAWFVREHREVPAQVWKDPKVQSAANCGACHKGADQGRYGERELAMPGAGRRHGHD
jgi:hypothetical protein